MSQENVEIVRTSRRRVQPRRLSTRSRSCRPGRRSSSPSRAVGLERRPYRGPRGACAKLLRPNRPRLGTTSGRRLTSSIDAGDRVVALYRHDRHRQGQRRPRRTASRAWCTRLRDGKIWRMKYFWTTSRSPRSRGAVGARRSRRLPDSPLTHYSSGRRALLRTATRGSQSGWLDQGRRSIPAKCDLSPPRSC